MIHSDRTRAGFCETGGQYRIVVQGRIDESWSDRLAGMRITAGEFENGTPTTHLFGHLRDQAQLSGVLNCLYDRHLAILLVEHVGDPENEQQCSKNKKQQEKTGDTAAKHDGSASAAS